MFDQGGSYCCNIVIVSGKVAEAIIHAIWKVSQPSMPALDCLVHAAQIIDGNTLYCANDDITCCQHAREQGCRKHEGKDNEPHLCAATRNVAHPNLKKDQVAESQQRYQADNNQCDYCENCRECIEWNAKKLSHVLTIWQPRGLLLLKVTGYSLVFGKIARRAWHSRACLDENRLR